MELKVWCEGIQRVVCGASATTTCQDVVFALAHATGQTGRFILIEKFGNNERVLAPSDRPLASLAKWGEYANDVMFIMKKSGDVQKEHPLPQALQQQNQQNIPRQQQPNLQKNILSDEQKDKIKSVTRIVNNGIGSTTIVSHALSGSTATKTTTAAQNRAYQTLPSKNHFHQHQQNILAQQQQNAILSQQQQQQQQHQNHQNNVTKPEPFVRSISFHKPPAPHEPEVPFKAGGNALPRSHHSSHQLRSITTSGADYRPQPQQAPQQNGGVGQNPRSISFVMNLPKSCTMDNSPILVQESLYSTVQKRPKQPPPYNEAIAKSSLVNNSPNRNTSQSPQQNILHKQQNLQQQQQQQQQQRQQFYANNHHHQQNSQNFYSQNYDNGYDVSQNDMMTLIDAQQETLRNQERDIANIDQELSTMQRQLNESSQIAKRYEDEMDILRKLWLEQEMLIEKLEAEKAECELDELLKEAQHYDIDLKDVKKRLDGFELEIDSCRSKICDLVKGIDAAANSSQYLENNDDDNLLALLQQMRQTITDKDQEIQIQECEMTELDESIQRLEKENAEKEALIERLTIEIKDANVESLSLDEGNRLYVADSDGISLLSGDKLTSEPEDDEDYDDPTSGQAMVQNSTPILLQNDSTSPPTLMPNPYAGHRVPGPAPGTSNDSVPLPTRISQQQQSQNPQQSQQATNNAKNTNANSSSRKIPVLPHELGNTVPTKKNPDGIWV